MGPATLRLNWSLAHLVQIPKPNESEGLGVKWPQQIVEMDQLKTLFDEIKSKM